MSTKKPTPAPVLMKRANYFMPPAMIEGLNEVAQKRGGTASDHLRKAVRTYLKRLGTNV